MTQTQIDPLLQKMQNLIANTIVKQYFRAERNETSESKLNFRLYENAMMGIDTIYDYKLDPMDIQVTAPHLSTNVCIQISNGQLPIENYMSKEAIQYLLNIYRTQRMDEYEELNNYYRMLMGLPAVEETEKDWIYINGKAIHTLTDTEIYRIKQSKQLDYLIGENLDKPYLFYLDKRIDFYQARKAEQFEILYSQSDEDATSYRNHLAKEIIQWKRNFKNINMERGSDFYEATEVTILKLIAMIYFFIENTSIDLSKNEFTQEEAQNIWRTFGMTLPKNMPAEYRNSVTYIMNYLTRYKGTNHDVQFVSDNIFTGLKLYKYFIVKSKKPGLPDNIPPETPPEDVYDVKFILRPFNATNVPDFKDPNRNEDKVLTYDEVVSIDPRWRNTTELKRAVFDSKFSYVNSKYLSLDNYIDLSNFTESFTIVQRCLIERRRLLETVSFSFKGGTGLSHNFFHIIVYYLTILTYLLDKIEQTAPDTLKKYKKLMGFRVPDNLQDMKELFLSYMTQHGYNDFVNKFPNVMNDNMDFIDLLKSIDDALGIAEMMHDIIRSCHNFPEIECMTQIYKMIRVVPTVPNVYDMTSGSIDGLTYAQWLRNNDPELGQRYDELMKSNNSERIVVEFDTLTQLIVNMFNDYEKGIETLDLTKIKDSFILANTFINGVSKYLLYILKMYKAYSADFLTEGNIYEINGDYNYQMNIDQMRIEMHVKEKYRMNVSQYQYVEYKSNINPTSVQRSSDMLVNVTPYGDYIIGQD